jgi:hypothetical protein
VMSGTDQSKSPRIKEFRTVAVRWLKLKIIQIYIVMKKQVQL